MMTVKPVVVVSGDSGINFEEWACVEGALTKFSELFPRVTIRNDRDRNFLIGNHSGPSWYILSAQRVNKVRQKWTQLSVESILQLRAANPRRKASPFIDVFLTSHDLTRRGAGFCYGETKEDATVQSLYRYRKLNPSDRQLAIQAMVWRELGRIFGIAQPYKRGYHCTNPNCVMYGNDDDVVGRIQTLRRMRSRGRVYCPDCIDRISDYI